MAGLWNVVGYTWEAVHGKMYASGERGSWRREGEVLGFSGV
jgi:hypothetical protein